MSTWFLHSFIEAVYSEVMFIRKEYGKLNFTSTSIDILEETGEPWPKKIKIDRSNLNLKEKQQQLLQRLYYAVKKLSNKTLCFPQILCDVNQKDLVLKDGNTINLITSIRPYAHFKLCIGVNLQSRTLRNIPFYDKCIFENSFEQASPMILQSLSEQNVLVTNPESWDLHAKEKPTESVRNWSDLARGNPISNDIWAENLITRTEPLPKDMPAFQSNENGASCHHVHKISRSKALYQVLKPVTVCDSSSDKILPLCWQARSFMNGKSDLGSLFYTNKNVNEDGSILSFPKQTGCPANNNFRRNKEFQHLYKPYSRKCGRVINPKLVKCAAFESLLQDKREYNCSTANEKNDTSIFSQRTAFYIQLKEVSEESSSQKCHVFSKATVEGDNNFSIDGNEKEKKARQHVLYDNQILQDNNIHSSSVQDTILSTAKKEKDLTAHLRCLNSLSSVPNMFEKLSIKHSSLEMMATMVTCTQKTKMKGFNVNSAFSLRKFKTLHFVLRANQKSITKRFRNSINFVKEGKHVFRCLGTCSRAVMDKRKYSNCEDVGKNHCSSVAANAHLSLFETYNKIPLSGDCEELDQSSFISKVIFNFKSNEKHSKGCAATASRITHNGHDTLAYFLPKLLFSSITNCNHLLVQESKSKNSQYSNVISASSQVLKQNSNIAFPIKSPNSRKMKSVLQDQPVCRSQVSNSLKHLKVKRVENMKVLLQKCIFLSSTHGSELVVSVKQNAEYIREIKNATVEKIYTSKRNQCQNLILPSLKNESANIIGSEDRLMEFPCATKQEHFEDVSECEESSEFKNKYEFEMKNQFDLVLKELNMFNDISKENKNSLLLEQRNIQEVSLELSCLDSMLQEDSKNICENKENVTFSTCGTSLSYITVVNQNKNGQILFKDTRLKCSEEQEVSHEECSSRILDEELFYPTPEEHFDSGCKQSLPWNPAFVSCTSMKERSYRLQGERGTCFNDGIIRVQPLKTCHGPLRVGLSRKAKPKQLHPYLK